MERLLHEPLALIALSTLLVFGFLALKLLLRAWIAEAKLRFYRDVLTGFDDEPDLRLRRRRKPVLLPNLLLISLALLLIGTALLSGPGSSTY
jgi:hypothetical protein